MTVRAANQAFRDRVDVVACALPGAEPPHPFDGVRDAWKVGGTIFTCIGRRDPGVGGKIRDVDTATMPVEAGVAGRSPSFDRSRALPAQDVHGDELLHRLRTSRDIAWARRPGHLRATCGGAAA